MEPLYLNGLNLTHIQSRPLSGSVFEYYFFIDVEGHIDEPHVRKALDVMWNAQRFCGFSDRIRVCKPPRQGMFAANPVGHGVHGNSSVATRKWHDA
ncbi:hypothetical protein MASR2M79_08690 [Aminivibrio sp.]